MANNETGWERETYNVRADTKITKIFDLKQLCEQINGLERQTLPVCKNFRFMSSLVIMSEQYKNGNKNMYVIGYKMVDVGVYFF